MAVGRVVLIDIEESLDDQGLDKIYAVFYWCLHASGVFWGFLGGCRDERS